MTSFRSLAALAVVSLATFAGCISFGKSDPARLYLLTSTAERAIDEDEDRTVVLLPVEIPKSVRRPQLVYTVGENEVALAPFSRWAEPLQDGLNRVVAENLVVLLPGRRIESFPFPPGVPIDVRVSVYVTDFRLDPAVPEARLTAHWSIYGLEGDIPEAEGVWTSQAAAADSTAGALVAAMSQLVGAFTKEAALASPTVGAPSP